MFFSDDEVIHNSDTKLGAVHLMVDSQPWRIVISMQGLKISSQHLITLLKPSDDDILTTHDLAHELRENQRYRLQIEYDDSTDLSHPFALAELVEKRQTRSGLELGFRFVSDKPSEDAAFQF